MKQPRRVLAEAYDVGCKMTWGPSEPELEGQAVTEEQVDSQYLEREQLLGHLEGEDASKYDPLELHKMTADLEGNAHDQRSARNHA
ncbi:hypothetical protein HaLaN_13684 [Haematococcus lacustris]|uniref:Uncharacterized protein n=1 Tax=Haematococcus lacustris TaxID=44745 RepID=A0A699Z3F6_HAELA|nr:hypothetical protein HaLaN_13684 [Haematococcus lacustris]